MLSPVVVVDDGSADDTAARAASAGAEVLRHAENRGKGAALVTGLRHLAAAGVERALTLDADGQHLPDRDPRAAGGVGRGAGGHRGRRAAQGTFRRSSAPRASGNWIADRLMRGIAGRPLPDTQSGFRVYPVGGDARARHARHALRLRDGGPAARRARRHGRARRAGRGVLPARRGARQPLPAVGRHAAHHPVGRARHRRGADAAGRGSCARPRASAKDAP